MEGTQSDHELIQKSIHGDHKAFEILVKRYQSSVASITMNMLKDYTDAEEVGQQVFIKFFKSMSKFRGDSSLKTYLARIAMNLSINELKRKAKFWNRFKEIDQGEINRGSTSSTDDIDLINTAIQYLPDKFRAVIVLRNIEGYDIKQTSKILDIPRGTVMSRQKRGLQKLKEILVNKLNYENG